MSTPPIRLVLQTYQLSVCDAPTSHAPSKLWSAVRAMLQDVRRAFCPMLVAQQHLDNASVHESVYCRPGLGQHRPTRLSHRPTGSSVGTHTSARK